MKILRFIEPKMWALHYITDAKRMVMLVGHTMDYLTEAMDYAAEIEITYQVLQYKGVRTPPSFVYLVNLN